MDAKDIRNIQEAYMEVYEQVDELDEANRGDEYVTSSMYMSREPETTAAKVRRRQKRDGLPDNPSHQGDDKDYDRQFAHKVERGRKKLKPYSSQTLEGEKNPTGKYAAMQRRKRQGLSYKEQVDIYDIILSHLLDEGYAETVESAQAIMVNMSEEWRDEIVEEMLDEANKAEKMLGLTPRQREQARNLHQYTGKPIFYGTNPNRRKKPDRSDPILNKSHKDMTAKRQASHKAGRHLRGDTGESGNVVRSRYQANKDHKDGYPSIKRVDT